MKRFYKEAAATGGGEVVLDARPVKTPAKNPLALPTPALAEAVAAEWNAQGEKIDPRTMPLTGLANAAIDRVAPDKEAFALSLAAYGESDLLCYRADGPASLVARQEAHWDPLLGWARRRYDVDFEVTTGIMHKAQPECTLVQLRHAVVSRSAWEIAALSPLVTISGSLVIALALLEETIGVDTAWAAATVDEAWQAEQWGEDAEAAARLEARRAEFEGAVGFLGLLR